MTAVNDIRIAKAKQGDSCAFAELYEIYSGDLYRFALYMLGSREDAEDAVQDAVFSAWRNIRALKDDSLFKAWLFKILSNRCKTKLSEKSRSPEKLPIEDYEFLLSTENSELSVELLQAISALEPPDGQLIMMSVIGGFKSHELASIYGMLPATVRSRQKRALEKLKAELGGKI